jgi:hypothetical protein
LQVVGAGRDRFAQQPARGFGVALLEQVAAGLEQFVGMPLHLRDGLARAIDIRAGLFVVAIEEEDPRPEVNGLFVAGGKVAIEPLVEQRFDLLRAHCGLIRLRRGEAFELGHEVDTGIIATAE